MYQDHLISDFTTPAFRKAFQSYFDELDVSVRDWDGLFAEMSHDPNGPNLAWLRTDECGTAIGFIQFCVNSMESWFFSMNIGFIREFWVAKNLRGQGHGSELLSKTEAYFFSHAVHCAALTTDTAENFYLARGYQRRPEITARNQDAVYTKILI